MIQLMIDGIAIEAEEGITILEAARRAGIHIPTLCYLKGQEVKANCRICLVEVKGRRGPVPACATLIAPGMDVLTSSPEIVEERRRSLQLILTHHPIACQSCVRLGNSVHRDLSKELCSMCFYCDCVRDGDCELQELLEQYDVNGMEYRWKEKGLLQDTSACSIEKDPDKCIMCRRCVSACGEVQGIYAWSITGRGCESQIRPAGGGHMADSPCVECGLCVRCCPVGALFEKQNLDDLPDAIQDHKRTVVARADSWFLKQYLKLAKLEDRKMDSGKLSAGLRRLGVDVVVGNVSADQETAKVITGELELRLKQQEGNPLISATCPAAVRYVREHYPELEEKLSHVYGAQDIFGRRAKEIWGEEVYTLSLTRCSAKKMEADTLRTVSQVMSPRELNRLSGRSGVDLEKLPAAAFDQPLAQVDMETDEELDGGIRVREVKREDRIIRMASAHGLRAVKEVLEQVRKGCESYDYIELMACPGGCRSAFGLPFDTL